MERYNIFGENEIPYGILEQFGITQEMMDDLPQRVMEVLLKGGRTPLLPVCITEEGEKVKGKASISLRRTAKGVDVVFTNKWRKARLDEYEIDEQNALRAGRVLLREVNGKGEVYVQLDEKTNAVMTAPADTIRHNIEVYGKELGCDAHDTNRMTEGQTITLETENGVLTLGVDLHEPDGIRFVPARVSELRGYTTETNMQKYNFGIYGCWILGPDGSLDKYVPEEEYTQEMEDLLENSREPDMKEDGDKYKMHI